MAPPLGTHVSIAGGIRHAIERGSKLDCDAIQVFVKNASQWRGKPLAAEEVEGFREAHAASQIGPLVAHSSYLINLAATNPENLERSRSALVDELQRCDRLGITSLVVHPGAHLGAGEEKGLAAIAESLRWVFDRDPRPEARILLENTAGQGTLVGYRLDHLATIIERSELAGRIGICIDTCHAFAAGYPIDQPTGYKDFLEEMEAHFATSEPSCFHLNDSRHALGSRKDRHANLGKGEMHLSTFARLVHEPRFDSVPMILETPMGQDSEGHRRDLETLRTL